VSTVTLLYIKYILKLSKLIILNGEAITQVSESIKYKKFIFDKRFNNGVTSKLGGYQISVMSSLRVAPFSGNVPSYKWSMWIHPKIKLS
jgi:hypothetical protein